MRKELGTGLHQTYSLKMTLHYYSLSQSASRPLLIWEAPQWHIQRLRLASPTTDCASDQSFLQSFRNRYRLGSSEASLISHLSAYILTLQPPILMKSALLPPAH